MKFPGVVILQGVEFSIFLLIFEWALQQCSATALPVVYHTVVWGDTSFTVCNFLCLYGYGFLSGGKRYGREILHACSTTTHCGGQMSKVKVTRDNKLA